MTKREAPARVFLLFSEHLYLLSLSAPSRAPRPFSLPLFPCCTSGNRPKTGRMLQISGALKATFLFEAGLFVQPFPVCSWSTSYLFSPAKRTSGISLILSLARGESRTCHPFSFQNSKPKRLLTELLHPWTRSDTSWKGIEIPPARPQLSRASLCSFGCRPQPRSCWNTCLLLGGCLWGRAAGFDPRHPSC